MDRRVWAFLAVGALVVLAGCWSVPSDENNKVFDHFSDPPDDEIRDEVSDVVGGAELSKLSLVGLDMRVENVTEDGFVLSKGNETGTPAPLWGVTIVGRGDVGMRVDEACRKSVATEANRTIESQIVGANVAVFETREAVENGGVRVFLLRDDGGGVAIGKVLVEKGYAVDMLGQFSDAEALAREQGRGIWQCVEQSDS